jgi:hypothetical protein
MSLDGPRKMSSNLRLIWVKWMNAFDLETFFYFGTTQKRKNAISFDIVGVYN